MLRLRYHRYAWEKFSSFKSANEISEVQVNAIEDAKFDLSVLQERGIQKPTFSCVAAIKKRVNVIYRF